MTEDLYLARHEIRALSDKLRELHDWVCQDLDDTAAKHTARPVSGGGSGTHTRKGEQPLPLNINAADAAHDLRGTLRSWVEHICTHSTQKWPGEQRAAQYAQWIDRHLVDLAKTEEAQTAADEIHDAWKRAKRAVDRPESPEFAGPCQAKPRQCHGIYCTRGQKQKLCGTCNILIDIPTLQTATMEVVRETVGTAGELADLMPWFNGMHISRKRISYLAKRGLVSIRPYPDGPRYNLGEVVDAHVALESRRQTG